jgi:hypothetical protein
VARRQHAFKVNPQLLRTLGIGEFVLISAGRYAKAAAALPRLGSGCPTPTPCTPPRSSQYG